MTSPTPDEKSVELLAQIVRIMEYWKITGIYIAIILTIWLVMFLRGS